MPVTLEEHTAMEMCAEEEVDFLFPTLPPELAKVVTEYTDFTKKEYRWLHLFSFFFFLFRG